MYTSVSTPSPAIKKHKKHKRERSEREERHDLPVVSTGLKLILKVGNQATPEYSSNNINHGDGDEYVTDAYYAAHHSHKKSKKKKKKKSKDKKHRHHHKERKRKRNDDSNAEGEVEEEGGGDEEMMEINNEDEKMETNEHQLTNSAANVDVSNASTTVTTVNSVNVTNNVVGGSPGAHREKRTCVIRQRTERTAVQKMCEHLLGLLEKKDPQQFFAWPVTENIAPGYSSIITHPMDFSTMRQKNEDNLYANLPEFFVDFKLICSNAMKYNRVDTIYYKTGKKVLHAGTKLTQPEKLGWLLDLLPDLTSEDVGFEITSEMRQNRINNAQILGTNSGESQENIEENSVENVSGGGGGGGGGSNKKRMPATKFEAIPDDLTAEEILHKANIAAREAKAKLIQKKVIPTMGYLKQRKDGTTNINILVGGDGIVPGTRNKRPVLLGQLCGKLNEGTGQIQGFREDRRNLVKTVRPLYYGAFGSYAPSYDSAFANLTKEESDLVYRTYGSDSAVQYAESILDFVEGSDYATSVVDSLLDLLTGGDHTRTKQILDENRQLKEEEEALKIVMETTPKAQQTTPSSNSNDSTRINLDELRSLKDVGIDVDFLNTLDVEVKGIENERALQAKLESMCLLLENLQKQQHNRLSQTPSSFNNVGNQIGEGETQMAESISEGLVDIAKRVAPSAIAPVTALRRAMGVSEVTVDGGGGEHLAPLTGGNGGEVDLESELRQFLESDPALSGHSPLRGHDKTIEEILME